MEKVVKEVLDRNIIEGTRYFISLVELGSYTAVKNFYSVEINTVKSKLEVLESYLGIKLTQSISNNKISITEDGMKYYSSCHRLYVDLESSILSAKHRGVDRLNYIRVFGTRAFVNMLLPSIHKIDDEGLYTFTFDSYFLYQSSSYFYHLNNYDIALVTAKDLEKIDQDRWVIGATVDSSSFLSSVYSSKTLIDEYELNADPSNLFKAPFILRRDNLINQSLDFIVNGENVNFSIKNIKYLVEDDSQKIKLIQEGLGVSDLIATYADLYKGLILPVKGISVKAFNDKQVIIVSKYLKDKNKIIDFVREIVGKYLTVYKGIV